MGEAARPPVSMTTADGDSQTDDDPERLSIPFGPLVYLVEFLALAVDTASSCGYRPDAGGAIYTRSQNVP
jgi:hypothetical protein